MQIDPSHLHGVEYVGNLGFAVPPTIRSRFMLEIASDLVGRKDFNLRQTRLTLREQGRADRTLTLFGSDAPSVIDEVMRGQVDIAIINPAAPLTMAVRGTGPFPEPLPLRAVTVLPSEDYFFFAVAGSTGLRTLDDVRERRYPLRISLRGQMDHSNQLLVTQVLALAGFSLDDIVSWGGSVRYDAVPPAHPLRLDDVERGVLDALFDEGVGWWAPRALSLGMRFLRLSGSILHELHAMGLRRRTVTRTEYPGIDEDFEAIDYSGWPVFTRADVPDDYITAFCRALEARKDRIPWEGTGPLPLDAMVRNRTDTPLDVPLHPAAERYWRDRGYL
jgi:TRAP-type uncharacterized transport system substrate-binding protein